MEKIEEIEEKIKTGKAHSAPLWKRHDSDFDLWQMKERSFDTHKGAINRTSNRPRAFADKCQGYLSRAKMNIRVKSPTSLASPEANDLSSKIERMLRFGFQQADKRLLRLQKPDLKNAMIWFDNNRGRIGVRVLVYMKDGKIVWDFLPLDPRHLVFDIGGDDISWFAYRTFRTPQSIKDNFGVDLTDEKKPVEVWDYWDGKENAVICHQSPYTDRGSNTLKKPTPHNLSRPPISLVTVPTNPSIFDETGVSVKFDGESIYAPNRLQYKQTDRLASLLATHVNKLVKQPTLHFYDPAITNPMTGKTIEIDDSLSYAGAIANLPITHRLEEMPGRDIPRAFEIDYASMQRNEQLATFADVEYGVDQPPHSGTALSLLREDKNKVLLPRLQAMEFAYSDICDIVCEQLQEQGITVQTKLFANNEYDIESVTPEELEEAKDFYKKVNFVLSYPYEDMQILGQIEMATRLGIVSIDTAREEIAQIPDSQAEAAKVAIQNAKAQSPEIDLWEAIQALKKQGKDFAAATLSQQLQMVSEQRKQIIAQAQGGVPPEGGQPA